MKELLTSLESLDWENAAEVDRAGREVLAGLVSDPAPVLAALASVSEDEHLFAMSEHYPDIFDKVVLAASDKGVRLRLHIFLPSYTEQPHNHRWSFASYILRGGYRHQLYGVVDLDQVRDPAHLMPLHVRSERPGNIYGLHHEMVHMVIPEEPYTVSLMLRGPSTKDRYSVLAPGGGTVARYGAQQEDSNSAKQKRMSADRLTEVVKLLDEWRLLDAG